MTTVAMVSSGIAARVGASTTGGKPADGGTLGVPEAGAVDRVRGVGDTPALGSPVGGAWVAQPVNDTYTRTRAVAGVIAREPLP